MYRSQNNNYSFEMNSHEVTKDIRLTCDLSSTCECRLITAHTNLNSLVTDHCGATTAMFVNQLPGTALWATILESGN